jgi:hypothetical protein
METVIDDVATLTAFQMEEPALDAIAFQRHESVNLALMTFSGRTVPALSYRKGARQLHPTNR